MKHGIYSMYEVIKKKKIKPLVILHQSFDIPDTRQQIGEKFVSLVREDIFSTEIISLALEWLGTLLTIIYEN